MGPPAPTGNTPAIGVLTPYRPGGLSRMVLSSKYTGSTAAVQTKGSPMPKANSISKVSRKAASLIAIGLALSVTGPVHAADSAAQAGLKGYPTQVRFEWKPEVRTVTITFDTGCRSAHGAAVLEEAFKAYLDRDYLQFDIQGGYKVKPQGGPVKSTRPKIGPADCMGSVSKSIELLDVEPQDYVVNRHGYLFKTVTLGDKALKFVIPASGATKRWKPAMFLTAE